MADRDESSHTLFARIPDVLWEKLVDDAAARGTTVRGVLVDLLCRHYRVKSEVLPCPRPPGRPPKRAKRHRDA